MTLTDRDRKLLLIIVPAVIVVAYWFLLLSPKREDAAKLGDQVTTAQAERDQAVAAVSKQQQAKDSFETDYTEIVRLGKAVPSNVDMPSLLVQVNRAAEGTGIRFEKITAGERQSATGPNGAAAAAGAPQSGSQPASAAGKAAEGAKDAKAKTEDAAAKSDAASGGAAAGAAAATTPAAGLDVVPLQMTFTGDFFDLADFMHRLKRYVKVGEDGVLVRGRLMKVETLKLTPKAGTKLVAELTASVYLAPKAEGVTAGATPQGPGATPAPGAPNTQPAAAPNAAPPASNTSAVAR